MADPLSALRGVIHMWRLLAGILFLVAASAQAETYYVDSGKGDDTRAGTAPDRAWQSLDRVNDVDLRPGDEVRFVAGGVWRGTLAPRGAGAPGRAVVIGVHGAGPRPRVEGTGADAVRLENFPHVVLEASRSRTAVTGRGRAGGCTWSRPTPARWPAWSSATSTSTT